MDLTDKEAALDAHCTIMCGHKHKQDVICLMECPDYEVFNHLPSVQPAAKDTNVLNNDCISRQAAIDEIHGRIFQEIVVEHPSINTYPEYKGKPYFSIKYTENGQEFIGYGTYKPEVLSEYLKEYFMPSAQPEITKEYNLKKIYNIYVKIAQANFVYQPSKPKTITAMPFDWIEAQNLLEKYLEDHGADFDALCREYVSENVKDDLFPPAQPNISNALESLDCIDRQAAIDAINKALSRVFPEPCGEQILKDLPSAHPKVIRCKDCTYQVESWSGIKYCEAHGDHIGARREENG